MQPLFLWQEEGVHVLRTDLRVVAEAGRLLTAPVVLGTEGLEPACTDASVRSWPARGFSFVPSRVCRLPERALVLLEVPALGGFP